MASADERPDEYVIESLPDNEHEGWFPLGEVSLIAGSSGTGKTTWLLQVLEHVRQGQNVFGHRTNKRAYCVMLHDRSKRSFKRTLKRMKLPPEVENCVHRLTPEQQTQKPDQVVEGIIKANPGKYQIFVIEGLDMWAPSGKGTTDFVATAAFIDSLQRVAEENNVVILGTWGSPKQRPKERYEMQRDAIFGSSAIPRKVETVVLLELRERNDPNSVRECHVLSRQGKAEIFRFRFQLGVLVEDTELPAPPLVVEQKTKFECYLDTLKMGDPVKWSVENTGMDKSTFYRGLKAARKNGLVFPYKGQRYKSVKTTPTDATATGVRTSVSCT